eukprot:TRINITY_DN13544_c0_g1_i1.p1 TRINITY_DN13544_c0_g1~~TRINITY_DN13544_c0_g1_i1.p1  ORF type:complete len:241 (-),score=28.79 TRINITY_DN13544_c0_g1_i1:181-903(-)
MKRTVLVWPWSYNNLRYHAVVDMFITGTIPDVPRNLFPDSCYPTSSHVLPQPAIVLQKDLSLDTIGSISVELIVIAATALKDENRCKVMALRARSTLNVPVLTPVVVLIAPEEEWTLEHLVELDQMMVIKQLEENPTFLVSLDDPTMTKCDEIQQKVTSNRLNLKFQFKSISSTPDDVLKLFSDILLQTEERRAKEGLGQREENIVRERGQGRGRGRGGRGRGRGGQGRGRRGNECCTTI